LYAKRNAFYGKIMLSHCHGRYKISFGQPLCHPKIGEKKPVGFAFLLYFYYITSFFKEWTGCQTYF